jgi:hypothetical protein
MERFFRKRRRNVSKGMENTGYVKIVFDSRGIA